MSPCPPPIYSLNGGQFYIAKENLRDLQERSYLCFLFGLAGLCMLSHYSVMSPIKYLQLPSAYSRTSPRSDKLGIFLGRRDSALSCFYLPLRGRRKRDLCKGLTRATYILCIEHSRQNMCLSQKSNPRPPPLQANTLCKKPFEWRY